MAHPARLLLVDDDEMNRDVFSRRLFRSGYDVEVAEDGSQALELLAGRRFDLVLLDNMMPGLSGLEVLQRIRQTHSASELPVIMVTAQGESENVVTALQIGANDYVTKPVDYAVTVARIEAQVALCLADRELRRARELCQLASRAAAEGLWDWDLRAGRAAYSSRWKSMLGFTDQEISDSIEEWFGRIHPADRPRVREEIQACIEGRGGSLECEYRMRRKDGEYLWVANRGGASRDEAGRAVRMAGYQEDITRRKTTDALTSLPNRTWLEEALLAASAAASPVTLILLELDSFERLEESLPDGGAARLVGDVAARLREWLGSGAPEAPAAVARSADHQFAVLIRDVCEVEAAKQLTLRLQALLHEPYRLEGEEIVATLSAGIARSPGGGAPAEDLVAGAYAALRRARAQGTGLSEVFQSSMRDFDREELKLESDLRQALERAEFVVHYQPKVDLDTGEIEGFEALVRWNRPGHGLVPPGAFIPLAERTGLIADLGRQVLERACQDAVELRRLLPGAVISVNVSGRQLADPGLAGQVRACLAAAGLAPSALCLEITETAVMQDPDGARTVLRRLREMGVGLKLDDFGAGYSSLAYLQRFPFDTLKIDRSFVANITTSAESVAIVNAIMGLARSLRMKVVAEGIEDFDQMELLKDLGCHYGQGYWFSRPVALARVRELVAEWRSPLAALKPEEVPVHQEAGI